MPRGAVLAVALIVAFSPCGVSAQTRSVDAHFLRPALFSGGIFALDRAVPSARWQPAFRFVYNFEFEPLYLQFPQRPELCPGAKCLGRQTIVDNAHAFYLQMQFGLARWLELGLELPVVRQSLSTNPAKDIDAGFELLSRSDLQTNVQPADVSPLDARIGLKSSLFTIRGLSLAVAVHGRFPFGDEESFAGDTGFVVEPGVLLSFDIRYVNLTLNAAYRWRSRTLVMWDDPESTEGSLPLLSVDDEIAFGAGGFFRVHRYFGFGAEFIGAIPVQRGDVDVQDKRTIFDPVSGPREDVTFRRVRPASPIVGEALGGISIFPLPGLNISLAAGAGVTGGERRTTLRVFAAIGWTSGIERAPVDRDGDGVADGQDQCPDQAEDRDGSQDEDGCPDKDNDSDGIADAGDKCPDQPEDRDGFQDSDGCPDEDNDGDGIPDSKDNCPVQAEDKDGFQDEDGCPDLDNDGDGIADAQDNCSNEAETSNGFQDEDGCPDTIPGPTVAVDKGKLITEKIAFAPGSATLTQESYKALDDVASALRSPQIGRVRIEGHTDDTGSAARNQQISQARAEAVRDYLIRKGVAADRLQAAGYGSSRPIAPNTTPEGRTKNRRVEFIVIQDK